MAINWGGAAQNNNALAYFAMGQQIGQGIIDSRVGKATANVLTGGMQPSAGQPAPMGAPTVPGQQGGLPLPPMNPGGMTPGIGDQYNRDMGKDWATIARYNPQLFGQLQQRQVEQAKLQREEQQKQREAIRAGAIETAKLFDGVVDENSYQQRLALAPRLGMNVSTAPRNFDPRWVEEQKLILKFVAEKPEALSTFGKIATDEGLQPGSPQFNARVSQLVKADALKTVPMVPGGGVAGVDTQTGRAEVLIKPYGYDAPTPPRNVTPTEGAIAENKATGERLIYRGGQWQPMGGQPGGNPPFPR